MAFVMETLSRLPRDIQEKILEEISLSPPFPESPFEGQIPIEINGHIYVIPQEVFNLINSLSEQIRDLSTDGIPENQRF